MTTTLFDIHPTNESRLGQVDLQDLPFGSVFSDHMFVMDYREGRWETGAIQSYGGMTLSPAAMALHYGQAIFEGMKAFRQPNGDVALFRPDANIARFNVRRRRGRKRCQRQRLRHGPSLGLVFGASDGSEQRHFRVLLPAHWRCDVL